MEFGAYFIPKDEWDFAKWLGLTWCARPIVTPDTLGDGSGFETEHKVVNMATGDIVPYPLDEVRDPENLREFPGSFVTLGAWQEGKNAAGLSAEYQRGIVNYFLPNDDWLVVERGVATAHRCADAWRGGPWTAVVNANVGGLLDKATERGPAPVAVLLQQAEWYHGLGATRILWWRYDTPHARGAIVGVMDRIRRLRLFGFGE